MDSSPLVVIGTDIASSIIISSIVIFLGRKYLEASIQLLFHKDLELFKHELHMASKEYEIKYSNIHVREIEVLEMFYELFVDLEVKVRDLVNLIHVGPDKSLPEKGELINDSASALTTYYYKKKLFFRPQLCEQIEEAIKHLRNVVIEFFAYQDGGTYQRKHVEKWKELDSRMDTEWLNIKINLESRIREILGVKDGAALYTDVEGNK